MERYKRMEKCLYQHRKEWDSGLSEPIPMRWRDYYTSTAAGENYLSAGPGAIHWKVEYRQPPLALEDHFASSHECADSHGVDADAAIYDDYDRTIDYGNRRLRLRKHFEWEWDRLYLAEEMELRKAEKKKELEHQLEVTHKKLENDMAHQTHAEGETTAAPVPMFAKPKLNRVEWPAFCLLYRLEEKDADAIDVLVGEPILDDEGSRFRGWYSRWPAHSHQQRPQDGKAIPIRLHSSVLVKILAMILGSDFKFDGATTMVFIRPFKALVHCQRALRDWCAALERKFHGGTVAAADSSAGGSQDYAGATEPVSLDGTTVTTTTGEPPEKKTLGDGDPAGVEKPQQQQATSGAAENHGAQDQEDSADAEEEKEEKDDPSDLTKSATALEHLRCLIGFIDTCVVARQAYLSSPKCTKVFFSDLWLLFRPGEEVVGSDGKQAYRVIEVSSPAHRVLTPWEAYYDSSLAKQNGTKAPFCITCVYIDFDGKLVGPVSRVFPFKRFEGQRDVTSLEVYPLRHHPFRQTDVRESDWKEMETIPPDGRFRHQLIRRGEKFLDVAAVKVMYYAGPTLEVRDDVESQVVVDFMTAFSVEDKEQQAWKSTRRRRITNGGCCRNEKVIFDTFVDRKQRSEYIESILPKKESPDEQPSVAVMPQLLEELQTGPGSNAWKVSDEELAIMSYRIFGFVLRSRKWAKLDLAAAAPDRAADGKSGGGQKRPATAFDRLVLENGHQHMIVSLISQHFRDKSATSDTEQFDNVKGKGKGLILLLHGAPGVGKTSTAEGVAEMFKKPLFQITCGDLGTTAREVEKALETNFALASRWDCILLLDEADVFLAKRTKLDFQRNGLVAVFLCVMEYYAGVLFLTTNRVGDFDEAFTSRIHVSLYYPELNAEKTVNVFNINMDMIEERFKKKRRQIRIDRAQIGAFATRHYADHKDARWNGRQIRNACQTALALAEFQMQGENLEESPNLGAVVELNVSHFATYVRDIYGSSEEERAKESKLRAVLVDADDNIVKGLSGDRALDKATAFLLASQGHSLGGSSRQRQHQSNEQQGYGQQFAGHGQQQRYGQQQAYGYQQGYGYQKSYAAPQPPPPPPPHPYYPPANMGGPMEHGPVEPPEQQPQPQHQHQPQHQPQQQPQPQQQQPPQQHQQHFQEPHQHSRHPPQYRQDPQHYPQYPQNQLQQGSAPPPLGGYIP
ncbi:hypothetical protein N658DRAFT_513365 [Parathielavia hyrcaniae]|uniref:AAA+ ATPase domain-containing protein n=1 Tax=Parathielavia hyrcaniae TaxID=113614 RepID=A0AAN6T569_9PEZI|nr:hypothetical protein N658DRAFT_513365 [Parathielavia hyrcaniae]